MGEKGALNCRGKLEQTGVGYLKGKARNIREGEGNTRGKLLETRRRRLSNVAKGNRRKKVNDGEER